MKPHPLKMTCKLRPAGSAAGRRSPRDTSQPALNRLALGHAPHAGELPLTAWDACPLFDPAPFFVPQFSSQKSPRLGSGGMWLYSMHCDTVSAASLSRRHRFNSVPLAPSRFFL